MPLLTVRDLARQFDVSPVFSGVTFDINPGERIGLVGPNGAGKTTLMNVLCGRDHADVGEIEIPGGVRLAMLEQHVETDGTSTLFDEAKSGISHLYQLQDEALKLADQLASLSGSELERVHKRYDIVQQELHRLDAYNLDHRVHAVLEGLGFEPSQFDRPLSQFSGGQQNRVLLARLLLAAPDLMLLDEPTNHLDIAATEWLEEYLSRGTQTLLVVSHDRFFLDRVTTRTLEVFDGRVTSYKGNFSAYWQQREDRAELLRKTAEKQDEYIAKQEDFIRRNIYGQKSAQAQDRVKKLERVERVEEIRSISDLPMTFGKPTRTGDWVLETESLTKGYESPLMENLSLRVDRGARLAVLGPNGCGKTTLLRTLIGELEPDSGKLRTGTGVKFAYYDQQLSGVSPDQDAIDAVRPGLHVTPAEVRTLLARFGVTGEMVFQQVGSMSGGERGRVALARLSMLNANVLVLDEPTNHLDLWARQSLEKALREFDGTLLFVSHDRYFVNQLATSVLVREEDDWHEHAGNYSDWVEFSRNRAAEIAALAASQAQRAAKNTAPAGAIQADTATKSEERRRRRFPYRKVEDLEADIAAHEARLEQLQQDMADPENQRDGRRLHDIGQQFEQTQTELATLFEHWEEAVELN